MNQSLVSYVYQAEQNPSFLRRAINAIIPGRFKEINLRNTDINRVLVKDNWLIHGEPDRTDYLAAEYAEVFEDEPWVFACVDAIATDVSGLTLEILDGEKQAIGRPWPEPLSIFEAPNKYEGMDFLIKQLVVDFKLTGASFCLWDASKDELWRLPSWAVEIVPSKSEKIKSFKLQMGYDKKNTAEFSPEEIIYIPHPSPLQYIESLSFLAPLRDTLAKQASQNSYEVNLWKNNARPSGLLKTEQPLQPEQRVSMGREWQTTYGGPKNIGKTAILSHGLSYEKVSMTPEETGYQESRKRNREEIHAVLGAPPARTGLLDHANYANYREQMAGYWRSTIVPLAKHFSDCFSRTMFRDVDLWFWLDPKSSGYYAAEIEKIWEIATKASGNRQILTQNEARAMIGYPVHSDPEADEINKEPIELYSDLSIFDAKSYDADKPKILLSKATQTVSEGKSISDVQNRKLAIIDNESFRRIRRHQINLKREAAKCLKEFAIPFYNKMEKANLDALSDDLRTFGTRVMTKARLPTLPPATDFIAELQESLESYLRNEMLRIGQSELDAAKETRHKLRMLRSAENDKGGYDDILADFDLLDQEVLEAIAQRLEKIKTVPQNAQDRVREIILSEIDQGHSIEQMRKAIKALFDQMRDHEARRIARTESGSGANTAAHVAMRQAKVTKKRWIAQGDSETRDTHLINHNAGEINYNQPFPGNGMMYPMQSNFPVGEVVNCRCTIVATEYED